MSDSKTTANPRRLIVEIDPRFPAHIRDLVQDIEDRAPVLSVTEVYQEAVSERPAIQVWSFYDAPEAYQKLSPHGGDEDWLALVPAHLADQDIAWMWSGTSFGICDVSEHPQPDGSVIRIGAHS